jgi:hypothetical protein
MTWSRGTTIDLICYSTDWVLILPSSNSVSSFNVSFTASIKLSKLPCK